MFQTLNDTEPYGTVNESEAELSEINYPAVMIFFSTIVLLYPFWVDLNFCLFTGRSVV